MIKYKTGDVVLVEFIFSEGTSSKKRPALIISSSDYLKNRQDVIIAAITSNIKRVLLGDTKISDWQAAGLKHPSLVTGVIQTIKSNMIVLKLGSLSEQDLDNVKQNLCKCMGFHLISKYN